MDNSEPKWETCLAFKSSNCPNQEEMDRIVLWKEKREGNEDPEYVLNDKDEEEAKSHCEECKEHQFDGS